MKKSVKIVAALCLMAVLVLTLAACGKKDPVGIWECTNYQEATIKRARARGISDEEINREIAESGPLSFTWFLEADHTATILVSVGARIDTKTYEWRETENGIAILNGHSSVKYYDWDGSNLVCTEDGIEVIFKKR